MTVLRLPLMLSDLQVGDVFTMAFFDGQPRTLATLPQDAGGGFWKWRTKEDPDDFTSSSPEMSEVVLISTERDVSERIIEELGRFSPAVRRAVAAAFCVQCGEAHCHVHR